MSDSLAVKYQVGQKRIVIIFLTLLLPVLCLAKNLGVYGSIYPIVEPDMLLGIHKKLKILKNNGELSRIQDAFVQRSIAHILRPTPVMGVSDLGSAKPTEHLYDPSLVLNHDIRDAEGNMIALKDTVINPLSNRDFDEALVFLNADNESQLQWYRAFAKKHLNDFTKIKLILVKGDIKKTAQQLKTRVYFDQRGVFCKRFLIKHTPTVVTQEQNQGRRLSKLLVKEYYSG